MRLLIATPLYPPEPGGPATYAQLLEKGLSEHGIEKTFVVMFSSVRHLPKIVRHVAYGIQVYRIGRQRKVSCILALDPVSVGLPALIAAHFLHVPFMVKVVGDYAWEQGVQRFGVTDSLDAFVLRTNVPFPVACMRILQRYVTRSAKKIIVPSKYLKHIVQNWGIPAEHIEVIYNAVRLEKGGEIPEIIRTATGMKICTIGRLVPWKGIRELIGAVSNISAPVTLIVVGDGPLRQELEDYARKQLPGRCLFTGALSHADTLAVIQDADMCVLNSYYEGLSHVLIEMLMLGKPVIATAAGGNSELIKHNENGLLIQVNDSIDLGEALIMLLTTKSVRERLAASAAQHSTTFSLDVMLEHTANHIQSV